LLKKKKKKTKKKRPKDGFGYETIEVLSQQDVGGE